MPSRDTSPCVILLDTPPLYLAAFDPEARQGRGTAMWTSDPDQALTFPDAAAAINVWRKVPAGRPTRPDGRPNRPLTAYSISIEAKPG